MAKNNPHVVHGRYETHLLLHTLADLLLLFYCTLFVLCVFNGADWVLSTSSGLPTTRRRIVTAMSCVSIKPVYVWKPGGTRFVRSCKLLLWIYSFISIRRAFVLVKFCIHFAEIGLHQCQLHGRLQTEERVHRNSRYVCDARSLFPASVRCSGSVIGLKSSVNDVVVHRAAGENLWRFLENGVGAKRAGHRHDNEVRDDSDDKKWRRNLAVEFCIISEKTRLI